MVSHLQSMELKIFLKKNPSFTAHPIEKDYEAGKIYWDGYWGRVHSIDHISSTGVYTDTTIKNLGHPADNGITRKHFTMPDKWDWELRQENLSPA